MVLFPSDIKECFHGADHFSVFIFQWINASEHRNLLSVFMPERTLFKGGVMSAGGGQEGAGCLAIFKFQETTGVAKNFTRRIPRYLFCQKIEVDDAAVKIHDDDPQGKR